MAQNVDLRFRADTGDLQKAKLDLNAVKDKIRELAAQIPGGTAAFDAFSKSLEHVRGTLPGLTSNITNIRTAMLGTAGSVGVLIGAFGGLGIAMALRYKDVIDQLGDMGAMYGYTASQIYYMKTAAEQAGGSFEAVNQVYLRVGNALSKSGDEAKGAGEAFKQLGIKTTDGARQLKSSVDVTIDAVTRYNKQVEEGTLSTRDLADYQLILGRNFQAQAPAILAAAEALKIANEQREKGIFISKEATDATNANEAAMLKFGGTMAAVGGQMVAGVIPVFTSLVNWLQHSYESGGLVKALFDVMKVSVEVLMVPIRLLVNAFQGLDLVLTTIGDSLGALFASIAAAATGNFRQAGSIIMDWLDNTGKRWKAGIAAMGETWESFGKTLGTGTKPADIKPPRAGGNARQTTAGEDANKELMSIIQGLEKQQRALNDYNKEQELAIMLSDTRFDRSDKFLKQYALELAAEQDKADALRVVTDMNDRLIKQQAQLMTRNDESRFAFKRDPLAAKRDQDRRKIDEEASRAYDELAKKGLLTLAAQEDLENRVAAAKRRLNEEYAREAEYRKDWVSRGMEEYILSIGTLDERMTSFVSGSLTKVEDGLMSLFTTGKFNFKAFVASILQDLLRMIVQFTIIQPILEKFKATMAGMGGGGGIAGAIGAGISALFSADGNVFQNGNVQMLANGGVLTGPTYLGMSGGKHSVGGEAGEEAVMPLKRNAAGKLGVVAQVAGGGSSSVVVQQTIQLSIGSVDSDERQETLLRAVRDLARTESKKAISQELQSGGMLNRR